MSWQQRESPVSWEGLGVLPSLTVAPCHTLALNTTELLLTREVCAGPTLPSTPLPRAQHSQEQAGG